MTQEEFDILIQEWLTEHGQELSQSEMSDEEFNRKLVAALHDDNNKKWYEFYCG